MKKILVVSTGGTISQEHDDKGIAISNDNDAIYEVGTNVKITYVGGINESYPAKIGTTKIEIKSVDNFELLFHPEPGNVKKANNR